jgi:hypothetical protein
MPGGLSTVGISRESPVPHSFPKQQDKSESSANRATGLAREYRLAEFGGALQLSH